MGDNVKDFGETARSLAGSPLGVIALFIVLVYAMASLVVFSDGMTPEQRTPLIYFLVFFPVMVFAGFLWLVVRHHQKLFGPGHFKNEDNYLRMISAAVSLTAAAARSGRSENADAIHVDEITDLVSKTYKNTKDAKASADWKNKILWVDDNPGNNRHERNAFEQFGLRFVCVETTTNALELLKKDRFAAVISDMSRREGAQEGYVLLDAMRGSGDRTPLYFYASSNAPSHKAETARRGGQGCTNNPQELFSMVIGGLIQR